MAIGDTGWAAGVQYAQDAISQAQASLAARPDFWTISLNKWIAINEAKLNKLLTPTSDEETQQLDEWAANNPEDATEWALVTPEHSQQMRHISHPPQGLVV